ncbi:electron transport complex subunit RsxC [bacterium]|nr:MAG: electron transport complex subunit RsxC [bacterium]
MVRLEEHKHLTENSSIEKIPFSRKVYIPLSQHLGKSCIPEVKIGDSVLKGQRIASLEAHVYAPIHSSVCGKIIAIQDWPHPTLGRAKAVVIESDGLDKSISMESRSEAVVDKLTPEQTRDIIFTAGIVGMGGAAFPTHIKLNPPKSVDTLIVNGAECEPYLTGDYRLMVEKTKEIIQGIKIVARCLGVKNVYIAIEDNKPAAIKAFRNELAALHITHYTLHILPTAYPQGGEKQLVKNILGREIPRGKLPFDIGIVVHNVATLFAVYEAVYSGKPLYERIVTVTGDCLSRPKNILARLGTPIKELIEFCGPLKEQPVKVIIGGPMMGLAQYSLDTPIIKSSNGIVLLSEPELKPIEEASCIRCGRCVEYCPVGLEPCMINLADRKNKLDLAQSYGCLDCMECGLCDYVCPQKINILQIIRRAKARCLK